MPKFNEQSARDSADKRWEGRRQEDLDAFLDGEDPAAALEKLVKAQGIITRDLESLARELLKAAHGRGRFSDLPGDKRLQAVLRALEWGLGKPTTRAARADQPDDIPGLNFK